MTPLETALIAAVSALFGIVVALFRQQLADWKELYNAEKAEHKETKKADAELLRENTKSLNVIADYIFALPKRQADFNPGQMTEKDRR